MSDFPKHDIESAPESARPVLEEAKTQMGFVPNLYAHMAEAPSALHGYKALAKLVGESSLDAQEQQVAFLAASVTNRCGFCVAAHSMMAKQMAGVDAGLVNALRDNTALPTEGKLGALARFTQAMVEKRGFVDQSDLDDFMTAGYGHQQVLEVVLVVAMKTLSNYTNHVAETETNEELAGEAWNGAA